MIQTETTFDVKNNGQECLEEKKSVNNSSKTVKGKEVKGIKYTKNYLMMLDGNYSLSEEMKTANASCPMIQKNSWKS